MWGGERASSFELGLHVVYPISLSRLENVLNINLFRASYIYFPQWEFLDIIRCTVVYHISGSATWPSPITLIFSFLLVKSCWTTTPIRPEGVAQHGSPSSSQSKQNYKVELVKSTLFFWSTKKEETATTHWNIFKEKEPNISRVLYICTNV